MKWRCQGISTERRLFVFRAGWGQEHKARVKRQRADAEMPGKIIFFSACLSSLQAQAQLQIDYWRSLWKPRGKGACVPQPPFETWGQCNNRSVTAQHELKRYNTATIQRHKKWLYKGKNTVWKRRKMSLSHLVSCSCASGSVHKGLLFHNLSSARHMQTHSLVFPIETIQQQYWWI